MSGELVGQLSVEVPPHHTRVIRGFFANAGASGSSDTWVTVSATPADSLLAWASVVDRGTDDEEHGGESTAELDQSLQSVLDSFNDLRNYVTMRPGGRKHRPRLFHRRSHSAGTTLSEGSPCPKGRSPVATLVHSATRSVGS